jgi:hypothetical protein
MQLLQEAATWACTQVMSIRTPSTSNTMTAFGQLLVYARIMRYLQALVLSHM